MQGVTESMAGRAAILQLLPFSLLETDRAGLLLGGYPEVLAQPKGRALWFSSYLQTYLERDVRAVTNVKQSIHLSAISRSAGEPARAGVEQNRSGGSARNLGTYFATSMATWKWIFSTRTVMAACGWWNAKRPRRSIQPWRDRCSRCGIRWENKRRGG
ncbi:MAG: hypothetical protein JJE04_15650 [Acidobacteriia bacterium]|nr:hypothetical protein [Terriglobia bacterium]